MAEALRGVIDLLERDLALLEPGRLRERLDALDRLERMLLSASPEEGDRIERLGARFEAANTRLYEEIRARIRRGDGAGALREWTRHDDAVAHGEHYDHLDALVSGVLQLDEPAGVAALAEGMVFYQPTPARHVFALLRRLPLTADDVLVDIGSGLGHVPLLAAIGTRARCIGVERDGAYVDCARRCAEELGLRNAAFVCQDARDADLSSGTVFYLYTPFRGEMLEQMLARLESEAARRPIRVATLGPCTDVVARMPWLLTEDGLRADVPVLFHSR